MGHHAVDGNTATYELFATMRASHSFLAALKVLCFMNGWRSNHHDPRSNDFEPLQHRAQILAKFVHRNVFVRGRRVVGAEPDGHELWATVFKGLERIHTVASVVAAEPPVEHVGAANVGRGEGDDPSRGVFGAVLGDRVAKTYDFVNGCCFESDYERINDRRALENVRSVSSIHFLRRRSRSPILLFQYDDKKMLNPRFTCVHNV